MPSRLIGELVDVHIKVECLEVWHGSVLVERLPRLRGRNKHHINYRHVIDWLVRKPGAFAGYRYQDAMFPTSRFRRAYDALLEKSPGRAAKDYLRILDWRPRNPKPGSTPCWAGSWSGTCRSHRPLSPTIWPTTWACRGDGGHDHNRGFVDVRCVARDKGGHAISRPADLHESLKNCLRDLHLPAMRDEYESAAQRARQESVSYERYLLDLAERELEARRSNRIERLLRESKLFMEKSLSTLDLKRLPPMAAQQVRFLLEGNSSIATRMCSFSAIRVREKRTSRARLARN